MNPYRHLPDSSFWSRSVASKGPGQIDPVVSTKFTIGSNDKVATMGSCFAQHISKQLVKLSLPYFVTESPPDHLSLTDALSRNYGIFSARYGNVYTIRQALQLLQRTMGLFEPDDNVWTYKGGFVDAFRPQIEPEPYESIDQVLDARQEHLQSVKRLFLETDVLVFTLGLSEAWRSLTDGSVYPMAPGVHGGQFDSSLVEFRNFEVQELQEDLESFVLMCQQFNPSIRVLLTVSPVPLIATYEPRHVLLSNSVSKSKLRVVADIVSRKFDFVDYFPSYEIITGSAIGHRYFDSDARQVTQLGVNHVMKIFTRHLLPHIDLYSIDNYDSRIGSPSLTSHQGVVCDEELIERTLQETKIENANDHRTNRSIHKWLGRFRNGA